MNRDDFAVDPSEAMKKLNKSMLGKWEDVIELMKTLNSWRLENDKRPLTKQP